MNSMTGHGIAETKTSALRITAEISSVNKRGLEILINTPRDLIPLEVDLRQIIETSLTRGRVTINITVAWLDKEQTPKLPIRHNVLTAYHRELKQLARKLGCSEEIPLSVLLQMPGVFSPSKENEWTEANRKLVLQTAQKAVAKLLLSRRREGTFLSKQLTSQCAALEKLAATIAMANPRVIEKYRSALLKRLEEAGIPAHADDERILKEIALFADRADITEETQRLRAHFIEAKRLLALKEPAGRNLEFLMQEIQREVNTIGSKANHLDISKHVIAFKAELEKIREQIQNLE